MKVNKDERVTLRLEKSMHERLKKKAKLEDISLSELIREKLKEESKDERE